MEDKGTKVYSANVLLILGAGPPVVAAAAMTAKGWRGNNTIEYRQRQSKKGYGTIYLPHEKLVPHIVGFSLFSNHNPMVCCFFFFLPTYYYGLSIARRFSSFP